MPKVSTEVQADAMQELRDLQNRIAEAYRLRDDRMSTLALSGRLSRADMASAMGLTKSRVDQIIREVATRRAEKE